VKISDGVYAILTVGVLSLSGFIFWKKFGPVTDEFVVTGLVMVSGPGDTDYSLNQLLGSADESHCFFMSFDNCESCIFEGIKTIESLIENERNAMIVVISEWQQEVEGWSIHYNAPVYRVSPAAFDQGIQTGHVPVLVTFEGTRPKTIKPIYP
jgi:hypothetical protein